MKRKVRSPVVWVGGKSRLLDWLLPLLDVPARVYVEPFGGSAAVLLNRPRAAVEVYNDADGQLVNLLRCVAQHPQELKRLIEQTPYARQVYDEELAWLKRGGPGSMTDLQRAARWWWLCLASFSGSLGCGFGTAATETQTAYVHRRIAVIDEASARLRDVLIERADFRVILERYDTPETLFYCDPPYVGHEDAYDKLGPCFTEADHRDLAALLGAVQGRVALSYYPCDLVDELYPPRGTRGWRRETKAWVSTLSNPRAAPGADYQRTELLLLNYDPPSQGTLF